jgi:hypothetical protein
MDTSSWDHDARTIAATAHQWMLPKGDIQQHPYVPPAPSVEQRVDEDMEEQRVAHPITRITDAPPIITAPNPTAPRQLKKTARTHSRLTRHNIPRSTPPISSMWGSVVALRHQKLQPYQPLAHKGRQETKPKQVLQPPRK